MTATGVLTDWSYDPVFNVMWGYIKGDMKKRFPDGTYLHTSNLMTSGPFFKGKTIRTLNSFYILGEPSQIGKGQALV